MACKSGTSRGFQRVLSKLEKSIEDGKYYEAHQMYRTLYFRYNAQEKYSDSIELLYTGSLTLLEHEQFSSGADLTLLLIEVLNKSKAEVTEDNMDKVTTLHALVPQELPERPNIITNAVRWSCQNNFSNGHPFLHQRFAKTFWIEREWSQSRYHYVQSTDGEGCASMLVDYQLTAGFPSEVDLFIAQSVLQYLCLKKKQTADRCFKVYTAIHPHIEEGPPFVTPLLNFLWLLLLAVEGRRFAVFAVLCEKYQPTIQRDPVYLEYLDRIGQLFFGVPAPQSSQNSGFLGNLLQSLFSMDGDSEQDSNVMMGGLAPNSNPQVSPVMAGRSAHEQMADEELD